MYIHCPIGKATSHFRCAQYNLLDQWAQYLVSNTLEPANQLASDAFAGSLANQTNLALKGIIGIKAMAEIAKLVGNSSAGSTYDVSYIHLDVLGVC